jgi:hypothetical protein
VPWLGLADTKLTPAGSRSVTNTPVASSGLRLDSVTVKMIWSPTLGVASLTVFVTARSAVGVTVRVTVATLLVSAGSGTPASITT